MERFIGQGIIRDRHISQFVEESLEGTETGLNLIGDKSSIVEDIALGEDITLGEGINLVADTGSRDINSKWGYRSLAIGSLAEGLINCRLGCTEHSADSDTASCIATIIDSVEAAIASIVVVGHKHPIKKGSTEHFGHSFVAANSFAIGLVHTEVVSPSCLATTGTITDFGLMVAIVNSVPASH